MIGLDPAQGCSDNAVFKNFREEMRIVQMFPGRQHGLTFAPGIDHALAVGALLLSKPEAKVALSWVTDPGKESRESYDLLSKT